MQKATGSYCTYSSLVKLQPLGRTAALVPEFAVKDLPLGRTSNDEDDDDSIIIDDGQLSMVQSYKKFWEVGITETILKKI